MDSPYARAKLEEKQRKRRGLPGGKGLDGQKEVGLSELDLLVGDVLYFDSRVREQVYGGVSMAGCEWYSVAVISVQSCGWNAVYPSHAGPLH